MVGLQAVRDRHHGHRGSDRLCGLALARPDPARRGAGHGHRGHRRAHQRLRALLVDPHLPAAPGRGGHAPPVRAGVRLRPHSRGAARVAARPDDRRLPGMGRTGIHAHRGLRGAVVALVVVSHVWRARTDRALAGALLARLAAMAAISAALALLFWHRFLLAVLGGAITERSVANDFAPESGSRLPLPMFEVSAAGALCLIGLVWIVVTVWPAGAGRVADRGATSLRARIGEAESGGGAASVG